MTEQTENLRVKCHSTSCTDWYIICKKKKRVKTRVAAKTIHSGITTLKCYGHASVLCYSGSYTRQHIGKHWQIFSLRNLFELNHRERHTGRCNGWGISLLSCWYVNRGVDVYTCAHFIQPLSSVFTLNSRRVPSVFQWIISVPSFSLHFFPPSFSLLLLILFCPSLSFT